MQVSYGSKISSAPSIEQSAVIFSRGRGRGRGRDFGGRERGFIGVDVDLMEANRVPLRKAPDNVGIVDIAITSPKSAGRNLGILSGHNYMILVLMSRVISSEFFICYFRLFYSCTIAGV